MNKDELIMLFREIFSSCPGMYVEEADALSRECIGMKLFDEPLIGFGDADDPLWERYRSREVIGPWFMPPSSWMPQAQTVISFFFPFSRQVRISNRGEPGKPSTEWVQARIQGQNFINAFLRLCLSGLARHDIKACAPAMDSRFFQVEEGTVIGAASRAAACSFDENSYTSCWSERHAAYVCGLGTFGLSKGLITARGICGRFGSLIAGTHFEADRRPYTGIYDYCSRCGICVRRCPAGAISLEEGKKHRPCKHWLIVSAEEYPRPYYGCGKCQTAVPCEAGIPVKRKQ